MRFFFAMLNAVIHRRIQLRRSTWGEGHASYDIRQANYVNEMLYDKCLKTKLWWRHGDDLQTRGRHHVSKLCFAIRIAWQLCAHDNFAWVLCEMHLYVHSFIFVYFKQAYKKGRFTAHWWCMPRATGHASYDIRQANYVTDTFTTQLY